MAITFQTPKTIWLSGPGKEVNTYGAKAAITPGHLIEYVNTAGVWQVQKHSVAAGAGPLMVARNQSMQNKGVDDDYGVDDLVEAVVVDPGGTAWMFIASGQNIAFGDKLESAGNGTLRIFNSGVVLARALETKANVLVQTRIRVEAT